MDDTIMISPSARGWGVAEELVLRCAEHREGLPFTSNFTNKGYSLLKRTHRLSVARALKAGLSVPQRVIAGLPGPDSLASLAWRVETFGDARKR
jgi:hypothetical protein